MRKTLHVLSCGIFQPELERIFTELKDDLADYEIAVDFIPPGLHVNNDKLGKGIAAGLTSLKEDKILLLYGSMCHPDLAEIVKEYDLIYPEMPNCVEIMLSPARKKELDQGGNIFYMTAGWLKYWHEIFQQEQGWDETDARINFGFYDKIVVLDSGCFDIDEEEMFCFFDYTQIPIEVEPIDLEHFKTVILDLCTKAFAAS
ncbi:MAG TPA: DUF1638 domain-containing protein [Clostridiales bacterium]|nr:DUF1638 domain-containing protein [Clostridiales bacterium]